MGVREGMEVSGSGTEGGNGNEDRFKEEGNWMRILKRKEILRFDR